MEIVINTYLPSNGQMRNSVVRNADMTNTVRAKSPIQGGA